MSTMSRFGDDAPLVSELLRRYDLLELVRGHFGEGIESESVPPFFGLLMAAARNPEPGGHCFVLDKTPGTTAIAATLLGLQALRQDFPMLAEHYARFGLEPGQKVRVKPNNLVYEYEGVWETLPHLFKLKVLDTPDWRSLPVTEVLRLEGTDRSRPKGYQGSRLGSYEPGPLDLLIGTKTGRNNSIVRNAVLVQMAGAHFNRIATSVELSPVDGGALPYLSEYLPWGTVGPGGELRKNDQYLAGGEPLIAVARELVDLESALSKTASKVSSILIDGASPVLRDLGAFDRITERRRVIILASPDEMQAVDQLRSRGCTVWNLRPEEVLLGDVEEGKRDRRSLVGRTMRAADTRRKADVAAIPCGGGPFQTVAETLNRLAGAIDQAQLYPDAEQLCSHLYRILVDCSESCFGIDDEMSADLERTGSFMERNRRWWPAEIHEGFAEVIEGLEIIFGGAWSNKGEKLASLLGNTTSNWLVAVRTSRSEQTVLEGLRAHGINAPVCPINDIPDDLEWDGIVCTAWPNRQKFRRLRNLAITRDIKVLTYPFEEEWLTGYRRYERRSLLSNSMDCEALACLVGMDPALLQFRETHVATDENETVELPISRIQERVTRRSVPRPSTATDDDESKLARLVNFYGGCHALLTEWCELHVLDQLIDGTGDVSGALPRKTVSELQVGDVVLFRDGGDKDLIRVLAEDSLGEDEYQGLRRVAELWKSALKRLGHDPAVVRRQLLQQGIQSTEATIDGWLNNPDRIGPQDAEAIDAIARAAGDGELQANLSEVKEAIRKIRVEHQRVGKRLTELVLREIQDNALVAGNEPTYLDLDYAKALTVRVADVAPEFLRYPVHQVNRILWVDDDII